MRRLSIFLILLLTSALEVNAQGSGTTPGYTEPEIKAAFILHLMGFITWPDNHSPSALCTVGNSNVYDALSVLVTEGQSSNLTLENLDNEQDFAPCDLLFFSQDDAVPDLTAVNSILTISEAAGFAAAGGMVELRRRSGRVELIINGSELQHAGFTASSRLMSLATVVTPGVARP